MTAQVLLLRGINVGGHGRLAMADLRAPLLALGAGMARTHIKSGNCACRSGIDPDALAGRIPAGPGFRPGIFARDARSWALVLAADPFAGEDPRRVHLFFHDAGSARPQEPLTQDAGPSERAVSTPVPVWLHAPERIGRSKVATRMEQRAAVPMTARNLRTVRALSSLLEALA